MPQSALRFITRVRHIGRRPLIQAAWDASEAYVTRALIREFPDSDLRRGVVTELLSHPGALTQTTQRMHVSAPTACNAF